MNMTSLSKKKTLRCDDEDALDIGGHVLCPECCHIQGLCCLEFGGNDFWHEVFEKTPVKRRKANRRKKASCPVWNGEWSTRRPALLTSFCFPAPGG
jgi:hypothetical protein